MNDQVASTIVADLKIRFNFKILTLFIFCFFVFSAYFSFGQPVWETRKTIKGNTLFEDLHNSNLKYYAPGNLKLKIKENGEPDFILTQLRYTGVSLSGDQGEKRFTNIIQMTIEMERIDNAVLANIRTLFHIAPRIKLVPFPIRNLESSLVYSATSLESTDDKNLKNTNGFFQSTGEATGVYWTERNFTIALDNNDAQLIEDQLKNNRLAFSFTYSFYADVIITSSNELIAGGDAKFVKDIKSSYAEVLERDSTIARVIVKSNSFSISIDLTQFPDCIRKVDINQNQTPPAYAYVEVRCHDFSNKLRSDLYFKTFELEAQGVNGTPVTGELKFAASKPDEHTMTVKFPYAVKMNKPPRYRVIETTIAGERYSLPWINLNAWKPMIDITTNLEQLNIKEKSLDMELDSTWVDKHNSERVEVWLRYYFIQKPQLQIVTFNKNEMSTLKNMILRYDRNSMIQYRIDSPVQSALLKDTWHSITDDYLLIK